MSVSGPGVRMTSAGRPALVHIDGASTCEVTVTSPSNRKIPVKVDRSDNRYTAEFTPVEVGECVHSYLQLALHKKPLFIRIVVMKK